ncbi:MAG: hypothetical protein WC356_02320 [Candidatus Micrarchaeia archaeon]|jgi:hypothetical protein
MPRALIASDVVVACTPSDINIFENGFGREAYASLTFGAGDGSLTYPTNGVPAPAPGNFGMNMPVPYRWMDIRQPGDGYDYRYDSTARAADPVAPYGTIRIFQSAGFTPAGTVAAPVFSGTPAVFGEKVYAYSLQNLKGADADVADSATVDQAALPTNSAVIDAAAAVAAGAWTYGENAEIPNSRNVNIVLLNDTGGDIVMEEGTLSFLVTGLFRGAAQTDTITFTFGAGDKTIAHAPDYRWKYGVKPFDQISSVVATGLTATQDGLKISVGLGRLLGVPVEPDAGSINNFIKITKNSAELAPVAYNDTNKTLDVGALSDNDDLDIEVEVATIGESYTPAGTNTAPAFTGTARAAAPMVELGAVAVGVTTLRVRITGK